MPQLLLSSAINRSRTAGNVVGSRLGLYFIFLADKTNTSDELGSRGTKKKTKKKKPEIRAQDWEPLTPSSSRLQDPRNGCFFSWKTLPGKKAWYEASRTGTRMDPDNTAVTDIPEEQIILHFSTQKTLQCLMLKLQQCSDDNVVTGELPCLFPCVPGQIDEPGRRGADLKSYSLTISCYVLSFA